MRYLIHERGLFEPPACPDCMRRLEVDWIDVTMLGELEPHSMPGQTYCRTHGCAYNDLEQAR